MTALAAFAEGSGSQGWIGGIQRDAFPSIEVVGHLGELSAHELHRVRTQHEAQGLIL